ncbi:hypothetical protein [Anaerocolumna chitinilytica]|uniref:RNA polymerase subunit sigma-70 n=1 Tax=Anaerocolumna chitinilytica TaxID=1727145 RepID=A0A7M3SA06_9FIRM|nr:hypothetical protein [Anaerocolumna chitinilytica]BCK01424.1 hypothetical protein bsdcttw_44640 [Anaerocolumna chitinilytica]
MTTNLTKEILIQYAELQEEVKDTRKKIESLENQITRMEEEGAVIDCVKGGAGGIQNFKVTGFPYPKYSRTKSLLYSRKSILETLELESLETINAAEEFIASLADARMRRLLNLKYIEDLSWIQVARRMGGKATPDSVRMEVKRYFDK